MRIRLDIAYDGTAYRGWARQPGLPSIQAEIEDGLRTVLRVTDTPQLTVAGRTDAGVHATGQVAHVEIPKVKSLAILRRRINGLLPNDIHVTRISEAPEGFDARFSALYRRYEYRIVDDPQNVNPLRRHDTVVWPNELDELKMQEASAFLAGLHDFAAFCKRRPGATTIRTLQRLDWRRDTDHVLIATFQADAFCHSMVRALVGSLIPVGEGKRSITWPRDVLEGRERLSSVEVARSYGLTLVEVAYPPDDELAKQAQSTRRSRDEE